MSNEVSISQNEIDQLLGLEGGEAVGFDRPTTSAPPPTVDQKPAAVGIPNPQDAKSADFKPLSNSKEDNGKSEISLIKDIPLELSVELGRTKTSIQEILNFGLGTVVELNRLAGEPVDLLANGKIIAKGEVVVIDENFALRISEIFNSKKNLG